MVFVIDAWSVATRDAAIGDAFAKAKAAEAAEEQAQHELTAAEDSLTEAEQVLLYLQPGRSAFAWQMQTKWTQHSFLNCSSTRNGYTPQHSYGLRLAPHSATQQSDVGISRAMRSRKQYG